MHDYSFNALQILTSVLQSHSFAPFPDLSLGLDPLSQCDRHT